MNNYEIDITDFFNNARPIYYSASVAELGNDAGRITWENAVDAVDAWRFLDNDEKTENWKKFIRSSGGWTEEEVDAFSETELNALLIQWLSGDIRESGLDARPVDWEEYEKGANSGHYSGRIYGGPLSVDGRVYFSISE